jgi:hypothetical protein
MSAKRAVWMRNSFRLWYLLSCLIIWYTSYPHKVTCMFNTFTYSTFSTVYCYVQIFGQNFQSSGVSLVKHLLLFLYHRHMVSSKGFLLVILSDLLDQKIFLKIFRPAIILQEAGCVSWYSNGLWDGWLGFNWKQMQVLEGKAKNKDKIRWTILAKIVRKRDTWSCELCHIKRYNIWYHVRKILSLSHQSSGIYKKIKLWTYISSIL